MEQGCNTSRKTRAANTPDDTLSTLPDEDYYFENEQSQTDYSELPYQESATKFCDLVHMRLMITPDYEKKQLKGTIIITLQPHFYETDTLVLDAKGMEILNVYDGDSRGLVPLLYTYNGKQIGIKLRHPKVGGEKFKVSINYIAKPDELITKGSNAITEAKGLYFINADGKIPNKPRQIWTQGETESNSCWFPTIDKPNQKLTQEIEITVADTNYLSLSNGELVYQYYNTDGTRTDVWRQDLPAAPYLTMIAIGPFVKVSDTWRDTVEVSYYVEPKYAPYAKAIFGNTPEMMTCFSKLTGVDYPWQKYSQIVVRDFVSGAMENTTAVVHSEILQQDSRSLLDNNNEDYISHELFHHWFGDLVTCESWSNLPLNESFATYGEDLWLEYSKGKDYADAHRYSNLTQYLGEAQYKKLPLIRYQYADREAMFDAHSYQKGGCILHMLRKQVGDDAFFKSLNLYLTRNKFKTVEIHDLRLAFEEVTGQDLNWFFNQWFLKPGHPYASLSHSYNAEQSEVNVFVTQEQDENKIGNFIFPLEFEIHLKDSVILKKVWVKKRKEKFTFQCPKEPEFINIDPEKSLVWQRDEQQTSKEWINQFILASSVVAKIQAAEEIIGRASEDETLSQQNLSNLMDYALKHPFYLIKIYGIRFGHLLQNENIKLKIPSLKSLALHDANSTVRTYSIDLMAEHFTPEDVPFLKACTLDSSYLVASQALIELAKLSPDEALKIARYNMATETNYHIRTAVGIVYENNPAINLSAEFCNLLSNSDKNGSNYAIKFSLQHYLKKTRPEIVLSMLDCIKTLHKPDKSLFSDENFDELLEELKEDTNNKKKLNAEAMKNFEKTSEEHHRCEQLDTTFQNILSTIDNLLQH